MKRLNIKMRDDEYEQLMKAMPKGQMSEFLRRLIRGCVEYTRVYPWFASEIIAGRKFYVSVNLVPPSTPAPVEVGEVQDGQ